MHFDRRRRMPVSVRAAVLGALRLLVAASLPLTAQANPSPDGPPARAARRIVLCLDGTANSTYDESRRDDGTKVLKPTNVLKLCRAVLTWAPEARREQIADYANGVGSLAEYPGLSNRLLSFTDRALGGAWGAGFERNLETALHFLTLNYEEGDQLYFFGFSRGAATVRGVTRFLDWSGGLPTKRDAYYLPVLFRTFVLGQGKSSGAEVIAAIDADRVAKGQRRLDSLKRVEVDYLGVWDTVMALGSRFRKPSASTSTVSKSFYLDAQPARCVRNARQALGIDEERYDFRPEIWTAPRDGQTLEQRWFAGVHSNVGGGYTHDGLANLAFQWILKGAQEVHDGHGLETDRDFTKVYNGFAQDQLYSSSSFLYRFLDAVRFRSGQGKRRLVGQPATANLTLDPSVIHRLRSDPREMDKNGKPRFPRLSKPYRPENVLLFLACLPSYDDYLKGIGLTEEQRHLPEDAVRRIEALRPRCPKAAS